MGYDQERQDITSHLKANFSALPIQFENIGTFDPPADGSPWLEVNILRGQAAAASLVGGGGVRYRHTSVLQLTVNLAQGKGTRIALEHCDSLAAIFRGQKVNNLLFRAPAGPFRLNEPETGRQRFIISIPFQRDESF